ncbi:sigma-54 interaction domain-containing protein [Collibacillus ludicampi]|uniref:sigma-54 interaction domain-containing protein n=1 Tax=Collibacillus ludicampi TaxID=2771369 RepID=UPI0024956CE2|nr:sigma 54-interacting transcriptional regulator [Collibacillus ludicampi]
MNAFNPKLKAFFDILLDSVNDAVTVVDTDGTVLYWNKSAENMYGIPKAQIIGKRIGDFFQKGSIMLYQVMETGMPVYQVYHKPRPDIHVFINAIPVYDDEDRLIGAIAIEQDITHTVKLSEELYSYSQSGQHIHESMIFSQMECSSMQETVDFLTKASRLSYPVLLVGENGVGKEMIAKMIHQMGKYPGPFLSISCDTIPAGLLDMELFGYAGGMLGSDREERPGKLDLAHTGTIYLKNISALPLPIQAKLADAINQLQFFRVGGDKPIQLTCRVIASSTVAIEELVEKKLLLRELSYIFHVHTIPPLRERKEDLPELCHYYLAESAKAVGKPVPRLSSEVITALTTFHWPGNLLQLRNVMEHLMIKSSGNEITLNDLPSELRLTTLADLAQESLSLTILSEEMEKAKIIDALKRTGGNKASAARLLGISRGSLYYKIKQYKIH